MKTPKKEIRQELTFQSIKGAIKELKNYFDANGYDKEYLNYQASRMRSPLLSGNEKRLNDYASPNVYKAYKEAGKNFYKVKGATYDHVAGPVRVTRIIFRKYLNNIENLTKENLMSDIEKLNFGWRILSSENNDVKKKKGEKITWVQAYERAGITEMINYRTGERISLRDLVKKENLKVI